MLNTKKIKANGEVPKESEKKIFILSAAIIFSLNVFSQAPTWQWARSGGGLATDNGTSICTDATGNVYVAGSFNSSPEIVFGNDTLFNTGGYDFFIAKYDASGNLLWVQSAAGNTNDYINSIRTDLSGNVYVAGASNSSTVTIGSITLTGNGSYDIILAKYDSAGNVLWARNFGAAGEERGTGISVRSSGIYVSGFFKSDSVAFDNDTLYNANSPNNDIFVAKFDTAGNALWARSGNGASNDVANSISTDAGDNVFLTGNFNSDTLLIGSDTLLNASGGSNDIFIAKYDSGGTLLWAERAGGTFGDNANCIHADNAGNFYLTGSFSSTTIIFGNDTLTNFGGSDIYVVKFDTAGIAQWTGYAGGMGGDVGRSITAGVNGNVYLTGSFVASSLIFGNDTVQFAGIFIVKYDASGNAIWGEHCGGTSGDVGQSIFADATGNVYCTGSFSVSIIHFGTDSLINADNTGNTTDIFAVKLADAIVGVSEKAQAENSIFIFPNPAGNQLAVGNWHPDASGAIQSIEIYDVLGERVFSQKPAANSQQQTTIDVSKLSPGIYFVKVRGEKNEERVAKFVKQ